MPVRDKWTNIMFQWSWSMCTRAFLDKKRSQILCVDRNFSCFERNEKKVVDPLIIIISYLYCISAQPSRCQAWDIHAMPCIKCQNARHNNSVFGLREVSNAHRTLASHHQRLLPNKGGPKIFELVGLIYKFNGYILCDYR